MDKDFYTLMIFSGATGSPRKTRISKRLVKCTLAISISALIAFGGFSYYFSQKYIQLTADQDQLAELRRESKLQKVQVEKFAKQVRNFEDEMARLERFEKKLRVITALENSPASSEKVWGVGGPYGLANASITTSLKRDAHSLAKRLSGNLGNLANQAKAQAISFQELDEFFKSQKSLLSSTPSIWPLRGWVTSGFGFRKSPFTGLQEKHEGWDIAARFGSPVRATADGIVVVSGREYGYGKMVEIDHGYGLITRYGHNSKHLVKVGDRIKLRSANCRGGQHRSEHRASSAL